MRNILKLLFTPGRFLEAEIQQAAAAHEDDSRIPNPLALAEASRSEFQRRIAKKRRGLMISLLKVFTCVAAGAMTGQLVTEYFVVDGLALKGMRALSLCIVAWAVLCRLEYETQSMGGATLLETTNLRLFKLQYTVGLFLAALTVFMSPTGADLSS